jgi:pimeloyl-ACP methyl ester carboxylesterase
MRDVVFLLPGICGSVLAKDGKEIWAPSAQGIWQFVKSRSRSLATLALDGDDPIAKDLGDGVKATRLVEDIHIVPGLWKIDGYTTIRRLLDAHFELRSWKEFAAGEANYVEVPYDWRRGNSSSAQALDEVVDRYLGQWRERQNRPNARAIFLAHSMGGLVAYYWLEVMGGWQRARALVTFGTPFRGSPKALGYLANGSSPRLASLTSLLRSCTSVYQLLPIYAMLETGAGFVRVAEGTAIPNLDATKAEESLQFHRKMENAAKARHDDKGYALLPIVGTGQPTMQSATFRNNTVTISDRLPADFDPLWFAGDGTVPYVSAIPIEMSAEPRLGYVCEQHGSIQNNNRVLDYLYDFLRRTQSKDLGAVREIKEQRIAGERPGLSLKLDDFFETGEEIRLCVSLLNSDRPAKGVAVSIESAHDPGEPRTYSMKPADDGWRLTVPDLPAGAYRAHIRASVADGPPPTPVTGLFEVADEPINDSAG